MYDYIVIGAGSAGCVLASRLTETPDRSVLLIEAGPPDRKREIHIPAAFSKLFKTDLDWNFTTEPQAASQRPAVILAARKGSGRIELDERHDLYPRPQCGFRSLA